MPLDNYPIPIRDLEDFRDSLLNGTSAIEKSLTEIEHRLKYMSNDAQLYRKTLENGKAKSKNIIGYKNKTILWNMVRRPWHSNLTAVVDWFVNRHGDVIITSAARDKKIYKNDSGIHMQDPQRAVDIRSRNWRDPERIAADTNENWIYDPKRPHLDVCVYHTINNNLKGFHFHLQVHNRTKRKA